MLCPKCYGKLTKDKSRCMYCGFDMSLLDGASNYEAKKIKHTVYKDDILYTTKVPFDVSKKKLLLFAIFLGLFGVHDYYVGKFWQGLYQSVVVGLAMILLTIQMVMGTVTQNWVQTALDVLAVFAGFATLIWFVDIVKIALERFKIPVYKKDFSKNQMLYKKWLFNNIKKS